MWTAAWSTYNDPDTESLFALVLNPSDQYQFSLFGTLDVAADGRVVRVDLVGDTSRVGSQKALAATVRLENVETGMQVMLADSFETIGEGSARFHNLKTTNPIRSGTQYRVSARVEGTSVMTATTTTPSTEKPTICIGSPCITGSTSALKPPRGSGALIGLTFVRPRAQVAVTAGGPGWRDVSLNDIARPDTFTNVEGGHGFVGGVYSDTIQIPIRQWE
ncbi:hypothetical protein [Salinibacter ruber]|uniref:hypothetical protein n=1 Tax=Salinibacter ruber TaxID=146919 RepID=UPI001F07F359|nr:hypothetical protein [Salinibacter ruber]